MRILVVDDSTTMLRIICNTLKKLGFNDIVTAENGQEAFDKYQINKPNLILTDWNMPIMNGYQFVLAIRKIDSDTPIVMITTEGGKASVITALKAGVNNYIVKPFTPAILQEKLLGVLPQGSL